MLSVPGLLCLVMLCLALTTAGEDYCAKFSSDGCSTPDITPYKDFFTSACYRHDACYSCGALFNISRSGCDMAFFNVMKRTCPEGDFPCMVAANGYYIAVVVLGNDSFVTSGEPGNFCDGVSSCLE